MTELKLEKLEENLKERNPSLAAHLMPGLPTEDIRRLLRGANVDGNVEPVVALFSWRNGLRPDSALPATKLFPDLNHDFYDLERMLVYFQALRRGVSYNPAFRKIAGHFFPLLWDGSTSWIAVDLRPANHSRVVVIDAGEKPGVRELYTSFDAFLEAASRGGNPKRWSSP